MAHVICSRRVRCSIPSRPAHDRRRRRKRLERRVEIEVFAAFPNQKFRLVHAKRAARRRGVWDRRDRPRLRREIAAHLDDDRIDRRVVERHLTVIEENRVVGVHIIGLELLLALLDGHSQILHCRSRHVARVVASGVSQHWDERLAIGSGPNRMSGQEARQFRRRDHRAQPAPIPSSARAGAAARASSPA
jgi:hypothetical protein